MVNKWFRLGPGGLVAHLWQRDGSHSESIHNGLNVTSLLFFVAGSHVYRLGMEGQLRPPEQSEQGGTGQVTVLTGAICEQWYCEHSMTYLLLQCQARSRIETSAHWFLEDQWLNRQALEIAHLLPVESELDGQTVGQVQQSSTLLFDYIQSMAGSSPFTTIERWDGRRWLNRITGYIDEHITERLSVSQLASVLTTSEKQLTRSMNAIAGRSPHQYILERRLLKARELLATTDDCLADVAVHAGFCSQSHMTRVFKQSLQVM